MAAIKSPPLDRGTVPWLLTAALATTAPHASHLPLWLSLLVGGALLWRAGLWQTHSPLPSRWLLMLVTLAGAAAIGWQFRTLFGRDSGVAPLETAVLAGKPWLPPEVAKRIRFR